MDLITSLWSLTGLAQMTIPGLAMVLLSCGLLYLAIAKRMEPLLLVPIGFGALLANLPGSEMTADGGLLTLLYEVGVKTGVFPLLIFLGIGAHTDFGPMLANPRTLLLGAAAQIGIFVTVLAAAGLSAAGVVDFSLKDAAAIGIIGGADGPTAIFVASRLAPDLLAAISVAAYSYMALVPIIQPPIMKALTTKEQRAIVMHELRPVGKLERILFPLLLVTLVGVLLPTALPLVGMFCLGNLMRECGVVDRLTDTVQNALINVVTVMLGLAVGSQMQAETFLTGQTIGILTLGVIAFGLGTAGGVLFAQLLRRVSKTPINPLIGAAGVSAVPMSARVVAKVGQEANPSSFLLMHAMGPNVAGVLGSALAAGAMLALLG